MSKKYVIKGKLFTPRNTNHFFPTRQTGLVKDFHEDKNRYNRYCMSNSTAGF